jgi:hypothetical protein
MAPDAGESASAGDSASGSSMANQRDGRQPGVLAVATHLESAAVCWGSKAGVLVLAGPGGQRLWLAVQPAEARWLAEELAAGRRPAAGSGAGATGTGGRPSGLGGPAPRAIGLATREDGDPVGILVVGRPGALREVACTPSFAAFLALRLGLPLWVTTEDLERWAATEDRAPPAGGPETSDPGSLAAVRRLVAGIPALDRL